MKESVRSCRTWTSPQKKNLEGERKKHGNLIVGIRPTRKGEGKQTSRGSVQHAEEARSVLRGAGPCLSPQGKRNLKECHVKHTCNMIEGSNSSGYLIPFVSDWEKVCPRK